MEEEITDAVVDAVVDGVAAGMRGRTFPPVTDALFLAVHVV